MRGWAASLTVLVAGLGLLYADVLAGLARQWASDDNYSHGFVIAPLAAYFVWRRKSALAALAPRPARGGLLLVLAALTLFVAGTLGAELFLARVSLLGVLAGGVVWTWGWGHLRRLAFPFAFLLLMIPPPALVFNQVAFPLQLIAAGVGESTLMMTGIPVLREGNLLVLPTTTLEIAEACSGIRSLLSLLTLAVVMAYFAEAGRLSRGAIIAATIPIAVVANGSRVAGTGLVAHAWGREAAEGFFHTFSGWLLFLVAFGLLLAVRESAVRLDQWRQSRAPAEGARQWCRAKVPGKGARQEGQAGGDDRGVGQP